MAFPTVKTTSVGGTGTATTTPSITLPTGITNGDKVVVFLAVDQTGGVSASPITWPAGWSKPTNDYGNSTAAGLFVGYRDCDGSEGASISPTISASGNYSYACYRLSGTLAGSPEVAVHAVDAVGTANPDPPSLTPSGGAKDYLWFAATGWDNGTTNFSADPTNYTTSAVNFDSSNLGGTSVAGVAVGTRQLNAASENPGTFTLSGSDQWAATTVAVSPALSVSFYMNNPIQGGSNAGLLDTIAPTASTSTTGWTVGTSANSFSRQTYNSEIANTGFTSTSQPSGAPVNLGEDCWRISAVTSGTFSAGTWYSSLSVIGVSSGGYSQGRARFRLYRSSNADGTGATEITQGAMVGSQVTELNTSVAQTSSASTQVGSLTLTSEFLFQQTAWETL